MDSGRISVIVRLALIDQRAEHMKKENYRSHSPPHVDATSTKRIYRGSDADLEKAAYDLKALIVSGARISWEIPHAKERAAERDVPIFEAERIVRAAKKVVRVTREPGEFVRWRVAGEDSDGRLIHVVVKPVGTVLRVVTVIRKG